MAATTQFANRYRKDLSTENLRTKSARRKSLIQKENRHKLFEKSRQFGLADVNVQSSKARGLPQLDETQEVSCQENQVKQKQATNVAIKSVNERKEMLQRYKEEKELRKLKEQREKAKKGAFKVGLYKPAAPGFLPSISQNAVTVKPKEKLAPASSTRITRSKAKSQAEQTSTRSQPFTICADRATNGHSIHSAQTGRRQAPADKVTEKGKKVLQPGGPPTVSNLRLTRAAASVTKQLIKPATTKGVQPQKKETSKEKEQKEIKADKNKTLPSKHEGEENTLHPIAEDLVTDSKNSTSLELLEEKTIQENNLPVTNGPAPARQRMRSFAPQNFVFQPLDGLTAYKVTPMTPSRANAFLTPSFTWSSLVMGSEKNCREAVAQKSDSESNTSAAERGTDKSSEQQQIPTKSPKAKKGSLSNEEGVQKSNETIPVFSDVSAMETKQDKTEDREHDVPYFRNVLQSETEKLMSECLQWDGKCDLDIPEDAKDLIRTTVGQTRLLITERFKQFEGLVDNCEFKRGEKETTCTDLDGFWDMVSFQVDDVNKKFDNLRKLQENGWQPVNIPSKEVIKKKVVRGGISKPKGGAAEKTARNRFAAFRAVMKDKMKQEGDTEPTVQKMPKEVEKVVFEAGFFRIESPVKSFPGLLSKTPGRTSQRVSKTMTTPKSHSRTSLQNAHGIPCNSENAVTAASGFCAPQNCNTIQSLSEKNLLGSNPEQSDFPAAEEQCQLIHVKAKRENETNVAAMEVCLLSDDRSSSVPFTQMLENPENKPSDMTREMELSTTDITGQDIVMSSPEKTAQSETNLAEELHVLEQKSDSLHGDSTSETPFDVAPNLDCSLPFTPLRNEAQKFTEASVCNDLIVFSPLSASGEK
ncbi:PREDICTED: disks large-associated protein 5 isoform X2 [Crocodylus porosus]|uniref:DLG associated protein 5 n=1 Tax=Crocodylus porosus TaxID=8502 RepID=A0A7M4FKT3_CROPO|nr:PREDICTED: disks large-associated protein 5 isoform X1 [Crocodylus porosus]XP_019406399.1 PREDICTED: disks large-associated protein 5 isoform X1 [Crocodylus porosus]XP_019406400.1 PREDICTED: disks large-associated protein 5 isoform X2 [Crocodylus porosus]